MTQYRDKYGRSHLKERDRDFADQCYDIMAFLTEDMNLLIQDAEMLVANLIDETPKGLVARNRLRTFILLVDLHYNRVPGRI